MATVEDLGVTKGKVRAYAHDGAIEKLSVTQLQAILCDYLNKVMRPQDKWRAWPKDVQTALRARGITQSHATGMPIVSALGSKMSLRMADEEESELVRLSAALEAAEAKLAKGSTICVTGPGATGGEVAAKPIKKPPKPKAKS